MKRLIEKCQILGIKAEKTVYGNVTYYDDSYKGTGGVLVTIPAGALFSPEGREVVRYLDRRKKTLTIISEYVTGGHDYILQVIPANKAAFFKAYHDKIRKATVSFWQERHEAANE